MCRYCEWGEMYPEPGPQDAEAQSVSAEERERASRQLWSRLMDELNQADAAKAAGPADDAAGKD